MDVGHYNCRDYYISPHASATVINNNDRLNLPPTTPIFHRHESFDELEQRSRSPASFKPKFPLLRLPTEIREQILSYLLPRTKDLVESNPLTRHAREFSAVQKRGAKGMLLPKPVENVEKTNSSSVSNVVWQRGNVSLFRVCRHLHDECAELVYGRNTFLLFLTYAGIKWRYRWLLSTGVAPTRHYDFLELIPERYMRLLKRVVVHIDHVDSYTGMIKFNVGGKGLVHGLRRQVQRLVNALKPAPDAEGVAGEEQDGNEGSVVSGVERHLTKLNIRVSNGSSVLEPITRQSGAEVKISDDIELVLEPLRQLYGVRDVTVTGAVGEGFARDLEASMRSSERPAANTEEVDVDDVGGLAAPMAGLCVYGNDI